MSRGLEQMPAPVKQDLGHLLSATLSVMPLKHLPDWFRPPLVHQMHLQGLDLVLWQSI